MLHHCCFHVQMSSSSCLSGIHQHPHLLCDLCAGTWRDRPVAVKVLSVPLSDMQMLQNEFALMQQMKHPRIVQAYDCVVPVTEHNKFQVSAGSAMRHLIAEKCHASVTSSRSCTS